MNAGPRLLRAAVVGSFAWMAVPTASAATPPGIRFHAVSSQRGLLDYHMTAWIGGGAAAADFDRDGDVDLFVPTAHGSPNQLYRNRGDGVFDEVAGVLGLDATDSARTALWFDYDGDHRLDLLVLGDYGDLGEDRNNQAVSLIKLYRQGDDGSFSDVAGSSGLDDTWLRAESQPIGGACAGDINNDGYLDLCVTIWHGPLVLWVNEGGTGFRTAAGPTAGGDAGYFQPLMMDFNRDGLLDIYTAVDYGANQLWINDGNEAFTNRAAECGVDHSDTDMGVAVGDYNNDHRLDVFVSNIAHNVLYQNKGSNGTMAFSEVAGSLGIADTRWGWGCTFLDADCDGWQDLAVTNGWDSIFWPPDQSRFFRNTGNPGPVGYADQSAITGFNDELWGCALLAADFDRDGDQDLLQTVHADTDTPSRLRLLDNRPAPGDHYGHWLAVRPRMDGPNHLAIGAIVRVRAGDLTMTRLVTAGTGFLGQEPAEAFFGLGDTPRAEEVTIEWPGGTTTTFSDLHADQLVTLRKPLDPPTLTIHRPDTPDTVELRWSHGTLQQCDDLSSPWSDIDEAASPWTVTLGSGTPQSRFYRLAYPIQD